MTPVVGFADPSAFSTWGLNTAIVNGFDAEWNSTLGIVPPPLETTHCLLAGAGGVSTESVHVGDVNPPTAAPVRGDVITIVINYLSWSTRKEDRC